jgi:hypothetical protein
MWRTRREYLEEQNNPPRIAWAEQGFTLLNSPNESFVACFGVALP